MSLLYAAYGSNLHPLRLTARVPGAQLLGTARLAGRDLRFHKRGADGSGKGSLVDAERDVHVAVYAMTAAEFTVLDRIEGVGAGYRRTLVEVPSFGACHTYIAQATHVDDTLRPYHWYRELIVLGARLLEFPQQYLERIAAVESVADPDTARDAANRSLIECMREKRCQVYFPQNEKRCQVYLVARGK